MGNYSFVSSGALMCYVLLFSIFIAAKKDRIISAFLQILLTLILWTAGSLLMRLQAPPSMALWYHISLIGIWMSCFTLIRFMRVFSGTSVTLFEKILFLLAVLLVGVNVFTDFFLAPPTVTVVNGVNLFVYNMTVGTYIMYGLLAVVAVTAIVNTIRCYAANAVTKQQFVPMLIGSVIMFAGQVIIMLPMLKGIPVDIAAGVVYAFCLFYALYRRRLFTLTLAFSRRTYCVVTAGILALLATELARTYQDLLKSMGGFMADYSASVVAVTAVGLAVVLYVLVKSLSEHLFLAEERDRSAALKRFNVEASGSLHVENICRLLCKLLRDSFSGITAISVVAADHEGRLRVMASSSVMTVGQELFDASNPVVDWCRTHASGVRVADFRYSIQYKSMWEAEKAQLIALNADYIFPLLDGEELIGMVVTSCKDHARGFHSEDISFISSADTVAAIAIKNSRMYEKACHDAQTDDLTGLLNRKYFMMELKDRFEKDPTALLTLAIINLDDFKLYNQLYGNAEGDRALKRVANILANNAGENAVVARYSGKEFALLMPGCESSAALRRMEGLRTQIYNMNKVEEFDIMAGSASVITCSIGICSIPYGASTVKQLLDNVDMTVYQVKQAGKNGVKIYSAGPARGGPDDQEVIDHEAVYSEFAQTIYALTATIDAKDHYTFTHSNNVAYYAAQLATAYGLNKETVEMIREAALLHDIGKISIPEKILNKPGRLTDEEYDAIKKHPENAVAIIRHLPNLDYLIPAVISHHERWDGKGYPRRIGGEDIPLSGRILCIADCYDAMTGRRCYQSGQDMENALKDIEVNAGKQFDPNLAQLFIDKCRDGTIQLQVTRPTPEAE
ncbi:MAG: diguanylate cyclase [Clostridia bacterium]|nr:diguanylate cyclase [Clostridia bacterium]